MTEYSLGELAGASGIPARTIRYYQSKGALHAPEHRGRVAVYVVSHLDRLRIIADLQDRGLRLDAIRDLMADETTADRSVAEWLGLDAALAGSWSEDRPRLMDAAELASVLGDRPAGVRASLERAGVLQRADGSPDMWLIRSPQLMDLTLQLLDSGVAIELSGQAAEILRKRLSKAAEELVSLFSAGVDSGLVARVGPDEWAEAIRELRPIAREAASLVLAQELERAVRTWMDAGGTPREIARRRRR